jgi:hypothetical protein
MFCGFSIFGRNISQNNEKCNDDVSDDNQYVKISDNSSNLERFLLTSIKDKEDYIQTLKNHKDNFSQNETIYNAHWDQIHYAEYMLSTLIREVSSLQKTS